MRGKTAVFCLVVFLCACAGCESLGKKFVRKPKHPPQPVEALLEPEEYDGQRPPAAELYDQYFLYWKSWHDELIGALAGSSRKRQAETAREALKNLYEMRQLLVEPARQRLDALILGLEQLEKDAAGDIYGAKAALHSARAQKIRRQVINDFSPLKAKSDIR